MNQETKKRIEKINNSEVPDGFKRTKAGIVPNDWKECLFKEMFTRVTRKNQENNTNVLTISAQNGLVSQKEFFNKSIASDDRSNYFLVEHGDYAYNKSYSNGYPYGTIKRLEKYKKGILSPLYICFSPSCNNKCSDFYSQYFEAGLMDREIKTFAQEGARNHGLLNISVEDFFNAQLICPNLVEQKKIAEILETQDKIIELKERKIEELKKLKKYYLNKMFPQKGSNYPEVRFHGFTDPWKQCKLGDCFSERNESMPDGELISVTINDGIKKFSELGRHDNSNEDKSKYKKVCIGDIAYNSMRMWQGASGYSPYEGIVSPAYTVLSPCSGIDSKCLSYQFKLTQMIHAFQVYSQGITSDTWNLKYPAFSQIDICISTDINEQKQIGKFFTQLDQLITLHQRELYEEKKLKKSLMQLLLTGIVRV